MHASIQAKSFFKTAEDDKFDLYEIDYDVKLAANIIDARLKRNMTQEELAQKLNTKQPAIARAENGDSPPSHKLLKKIARILRAKLQPATFELENDIITDKLNIIELDRDLPDFLDSQFIAKFSRAATISK